MTCPKISDCPVFNALQFNSEYYWLRNYCHFDYKKCSRIASEEKGTVVPMNLLPDGQTVAFN